MTTSGGDSESGVSVSDSATSNVSAGDETSSGGETDSGTGGASSGDDGCGCSTNTTGTGVLWSVLGLLGLSTLRRRRR